MEDKNQLLEKLYNYITQIIAETNGVCLSDTLSLMTSKTASSYDVGDEVLETIRDFAEKLDLFHINKIKIEELLDHPFSFVMERFFKNFPLKYNEEHTHLTGSLTGEFVYDYLMDLFKKDESGELEKKVKEVYGEDAWPIESAEKLSDLISVEDDQFFTEYLQIMMLPKLIMTSKEMHVEAAYHMAHDMFHNYNVGQIRLKFTMSRANSSSTSETIPGIEELTSEDVVMGLFEGFMKFKSEEPSFNFILSPCFRKESDYFDKNKFDTKQEDVLSQVNTIIELIEKHPELRNYLKEVDTVGDEKHFYRKQHFNDMKKGFRKLQSYGFRIRSHHGETWKTLRHGIQAVDNAMNIWRIDTLEHGVSLGVNPNYYYHLLYQRILTENHEGESIEEGSRDYNELMDMDFGMHTEVRDKLLKGERLNNDEELVFTKAKYHTAREVEHYQHDVLNRLIDKRVSLVALPSSNYKLTSIFTDFKEHPFSWWEKKGVVLGVGTDNYVTLDTNFLREMLILLYTDSQNLKITKLLMVTTGEKRRAYVSKLLWQMRGEV